MTILIYEDIKSEALADAFRSLVTLTNRMSPASKENGAAPV